MEFQERKSRAVRFLTITCHSERAKWCMNLAEWGRRNWRVRRSGSLPVCSSAWFPGRLSLLHSECKPLHCDNNRNSTHTPAGKKKKSRQLSVIKLRVVTDSDFSVLGKEISPLVVAGVRWRLALPLLQQPDLTGFSKETRSLAAENGLKAQLAFCNNSLFILHYEKAWKGICFPR